MTWEKKHPTRRERIAWALRNLADRIDGEMSFSVGGDGLTRADVRLAIEEAAPIIMARARQAAAARHEIEDAICRLIDE